jgi:predicted metal-binding membrane protein
MANVITRRPATPAIVLVAMLGLAAACWAAAAWLMNGMSMGVATRPGPFAFFAAAWVTMMAAMMLPGAAPAVAKYARLGGELKAALFAGTYLAVWALAGIAAYVLDLPHGPVAAGAVVVAAGTYELTPVKRHFRQRCRDDLRSGLGFGLCCVGSSIGLMAMLVAVDVMSLFWMAVITVIACGQKLLPAKAVIDIPVALALIGLGLVIVLEPALIPGLAPPMM